MSKVKSLATLAKEMRKLRKKPTQEGEKFGTKKDMVMAKDTPFSKDLDIKVVAGREGKTAAAGKINIGDDVVGFNNFLKMQQSKSGLSRAKFKEKLNSLLIDIELFDNWFSLPKKFPLLTMSNLEKSLAKYPLKRIPLVISFLIIIPSPELLKIKLSEIDFNFWLFNYSFAILFS